MEARDEECQQYRRSHEETKQSLIELATKYQELLVQVDDLQATLNDTKLKYSDKLNQADYDKQQMEVRISELVDNEKSLTTQVS